ncbi:MAG: four helix bundle protein [Planctomycetaceae bacterium]|nr:four helix bundle protein [Planctomycetaceae bacterium]
MGARSFEELEVWKKSDEVARGVFELTLAFPAHQRYVLTPQMQRAALSIPANITEGFGRRRPKDKARFYNIAEASADEVHYYFIFATRMRYLARRSPFQDPLIEVPKMLRRLVDLPLLMA